MVLWINSYVVENEEEICEEMEVGNGWWAMAVGNGQLAIPALNSRRLIQGIMKRVHELKTLSIINCPLSIKLSVIH